MDCPKHLGLCYTLEMKAVIKPSQCSAIDEAIRQETL